MIQYNLTKELECVHCMFKLYESYIDSKSFSVHMAAAPSAPNWCKAGPVLQVREMLVYGISDLISVLSGDIISVETTLYSRENSVFDEKHL
ncbi:hypothetical protein CDAR_396131 [Caerostris darwini]|uniref:Uncharacterized protein n=1 Tax=Caerostris darwini TaxID=1538125 RepID=A0AAV4WP68_9ARAC|nr:hypothetical protein CDAR_396131 [Caerostris darwini]